MEIFPYSQEVRAHTPASGFLEPVSEDRRVFTVADPSLPFADVTQIRVMADMTNEGIANPVACTVLPYTTEFEEGTTDIGPTKETVLGGTSTAGIQTHLGKTLYVEHDEAELRYTWATEDIKEGFLVAPALTAIDISVAVPQYSWSVAGTTVDVDPSVDADAYLTCAADEDHLLIFTSFRYQGTYVDGQAVEHSINIVKKIVILIVESSGKVVAIEFTTLVPPTVPALIYPSSPTGFYVTAIEGGVSGPQYAHMVTFAHLDLDTIGNLDLADTTIVDTFHTSPAGAIRFGQQYHTAEGLSTFSDGPEIYVFKFNVTTEAMDIDATLAYTSAAQPLSSTIAEDEDGNFYLFYADHTTTEVFEITSVDDGVNWSTPVSRFPPASGADHIYTAAPGAIFVGKPGETWIYRSRYMESVVANEVKFNPNTLEFEFEQPIAAGSRPVYQVSVSSTVYAAATTPEQIMRFQLEAIIPAGVAVTPAIDLIGFRLFGVYVPKGWGTADISLELSPDSIAWFRYLVKSDQWIADPGDCSDGGAYIELPSESLANIRHVRVWSGTPKSPVNQTYDQTLLMDVRIVDSGFVGQVASMRSPSENYLAISTESYILAGSPVETSIILPTAFDNPGRIITIKKLSVNGFDVIIYGQGGDLVEGSTQYLLENQYEAVSLISSGDAWYIV